MPVSPDIMRAVLVVCLMGMTLLAVFFLRQRRLSFTAYLGWGLFIVLFPLIGPFVVILTRPGQPRL